MLVKIYICLRAMNNTACAVGNSKRKISGSRSAKGRRGS